MHPEIVRALMNERVREAQASAAVREHGTRRPLWPFRDARPRTAWKTRTV
ncbi:hypothetical protein [Actinomadura sp. DC4]|nr:hypothetical protein [Actinomadura sp. DC4]MDN3356708.1 hypothetical protein [Actinomadura sp. DC4]